MSIYKSHIVSLGNLYINSRTTEQVSFKVKLLLGYLLLTITGGYSQEEQLSYCSGESQGGGCGVGWMHKLWLWHLRQVFTPIHVFCDYNWSFATRIFPQNFLIHNRSLFSANIIRLSIWTSPCCTSGKYNWWAFAWTPSVLLADINSYLVCKFILEDWYPISPC